MARTVRMVLEIVGVLAVAAAPVVAADAASGSVVAPTFARDVAPIFQQKCQACHRPESIAPMSLITYEDVRPWARSIRTRVAARQMPPWHLDKTVGVQHFENDASLSDKQIDTILRWVDAGAPAGDMKDMPPAMKWPSGDTWEFAEKFGKPDLIVKSPAWHMAAQAQDAWYKPIVDTGLTEQRWVRAIEIRPSTKKGRRITHHALARLKQDDGGDPTKTSGDIADQTGGLFMEWAVGKQGELMRPNTGKLMLPGSKIIFDIHYHAVGEDITDSVELGIYFYPKGQEPKYRTVLGSFESIAGGKEALDIPPNSIAVTSDTHVMKRAGRIENFQPHMHLRGKAMLMEAILPDGTTRTLSYVNNFQFNWHLNYVYADDAAPILPKGTVLKFTSWHDNTAANKENPDPNQWVGWGERTVDEMAHAWVNITYMSDDDYARLIAARN
jgi:mono/diheme cytochrome c family protein